MDIGCSPADLPRAIEDLRCGPKDPEGDGGYGIMRGPHPSSGSSMGLRLLGTTVVLVAGLAGSDRAAAAPDEIVNYREYSEYLSSSGQPDEEQFEALGEAGFERVIFLAFSDSDGSLASEDRVVRDLGMDYTHVPVIWEAPTKRDFYTFAAVMQREPAQKTLVHCQVNYRASSFSFLYRVLYEAVPMDVAKDDLNSVWVPNDTWRALIFSILEENAVSPNCHGCLWEGD
jgi:protein tyrosine phosphatase (PTP) superfamily phosphohydrolase (DUF442 family)